MRCNSVETYKAEQTIKIVWEVGLYFILAYFSKIIKLLFPLRYPIFCDTLFFDGFDTSICMCSLQASASIISTCFYSHNFLSITPISAFIFSQITCRRYFVQILCDICNSILYVLYYLCQVSFLLPPSFSCPGW